MKTNTVAEQFAFEVSYSDYNTSGDTQVSWSQLRNDAIGTRYFADVDSNCGRDVYEKSAELVYRSETGAAVVFHVSGTTDEPNPQDWKKEDTLVWFEFN